MGLSKRVGASPGHTGTRSQGPWEGSGRGPERGRVEQQPQTACVTVCPALPLTLPLGKSLSLSPGFGEGQQICWSCLSAHWICPVPLSWVSVHAP